jgi:hypothetical protein
MTLEDFAPFSEVRDELAYRNLLGDHLSPRERAMLDALNAILDGLLPRQAEISDSAREAMAELARLSSLRTDGNRRPR